jgi:hypothetical protein
VGSSAALTRSLIQYDRAGSGDVERANASGHGDAQKVIAGAADEIMQPRAFAAQNEHTIAGEVELVVVGCTTLIEANNPNVLTLQLLKRTDEVDDTGDAQMFGGSCAGLHGNRAQGCRTPLREDDAVDAGSIGYAQQCAKILRIFDAIESEHQPGSAGPHRRKNILDRQFFLRTYDRYDALMRWCSGKLRELLAGFLPNSHAGLAARSDEVGKSVVVAFAGDQNMIKTALAGFKGLLDGMEAVENFHDSSLDCR